MNKGNSLLKIILVIILFIIAAKMLFPAVKFIVRFIIGLFAIVLITRILNSEDD
ncbi:MAG: hypothetical protein Q4B36_07080 [Tissierellia bacterium]|nr:hypothetical protein [Tissierellia bacterium]